MLKKTEIKLPQNQSISIEKGLVIVGANGSGKTRLGLWLMDHAYDKKLVRRISAQKSLAFPKEINPTSIEHSLNQLQRIQSYDSATTMSNDFKQLLDHLVSVENDMNRLYKEDSRSATEKVPVPLTNLDKVKAIWEEILPHRSLVIEKGEIKVKSKSENAESYSASEMSDGERVIFYLIGRCLSAPENGMIIIDEPEMHLHKAIQSTLWNKIEQARSDCIFIYLTHDVIFAVSRSGFKKIHVMGYNEKDNWQLKEVIEETELPEELLLELYGSRRKVLLIEGPPDSIEAKFYQNIFDDFLIKPCGSCETVISYVRSLRNNSQFHHEKIYGLIDRDRRTDEEIKPLKEDDIFTLEVAEFENLFAIPEVLEILSETLQFDPNEKLEEVKDFIFDALNKEIETQIQGHIQQEIRWRLNRLDISKLKNITLMNLINEEIDEEGIRSSLTVEFENLLKDRNYQELLKKYNRKTISSRIGPIFDFQEKGALPNCIVRLSATIEYQEKLRNAILKYLPIEFINILNILKTFKNKQTVIIKPQGSILEPVSEEN